MTCNICPRKCNANRSQKPGFCDCGENICISYTMRHYWEEPCISGKSGSGAIFFSGCNLKCIYCQNYSVSNGETGKNLTESEFCNLVLNIASSGVHNINLVTPTHFTQNIVSALSKIKSEITVPIVWNSSGYENPESIRMLRGIVDIFLCDIKYKSSKLSKEYSGAEDYFDTAKKALEEMLGITGVPVFTDEGLLSSGVIVRHLVLPGSREDSADILRELEYVKSEIVLSLMRQYTPTPQTRHHPKLSRHLTSLEYKAVTDLALSLGYKGYIQSKESVGIKYTPDFEMTWGFNY